MEPLSIAEENYIKTIYKLTFQGDESALTNAISTQMETSAASVTDMLKRLSSKKLINYEKHRGATLTKIGLSLALQLVRKHRLWETFLVHKLGFTWDEVHLIAEELEHIHSPLLIERLDDFLGRPTFDPHGDPIPDAQGKMVKREVQRLSDLAKGQSATLVGVTEHSTHFLQFLDQLGLNLGATVEIIEQYDYQQSLLVRISRGNDIIRMNTICNNLLVELSEGN